jgi:hypothetical protein
MPVSFSPELCIRFAEIGILVFYPRHNKQQVREPVQVNQYVLPRIRSFLFDQLDDLPSALLATVLAK